MKADYNSEEIAEYIANSWKAHHQKNWEEVRINLIEEHKARYDLSQKSAEVAVDLYIRAKREYDFAKELMNQGDEKSSKYYQNSIKRNLTLYLALSQKRSIGQDKGAVDKIVGFLDDAFENDEEFRKWAEEKNR